MAELKDVPLHPADVENPVASSPESKFFDSPTCADVFMKELRVESGDMMHPMTGKVFVECIRKYANSGNKTDLSRIDKHHRPDSQADAKLIINDIDYIVGRFDKDINERHHEIKDRFGSCDMNSNSAVLDVWYKIYPDIKGPITRIRKAIHSDEDSNKARHSNIRRRLICSDVWHHVVRLIIQLVAFGMLITQLKVVECDTDACLYVIPWFGIYVPLSLLAQRLCRVFAEKAKSEVANPLDSSIQSYAWPGQRKCVNDCDKMKWAKLLYALLLIDSIDEFHTARCGPPSPQANRKT